MFYTALKYFVRIGLYWYAPDIRQQHLPLATYAGPTVVVSNHPNSLFDALVIAAYCPAEIWFLTRGDIFRHPVANLLLRNLFQLPIFKKSDDEEFAVKNDFTFDECIRLLSRGKHVLIFPEGRSLNIWALQPFMNGGLTSLLERAYRAEVPLQLQPYVLNYNSFRHVPKSVAITALPPVDSTDYIENHRIQAATLIAELRARLRAAMTEKPLAAIPLSDSEQRLLRIPAKIGYYTQFWFYRLWRDYIRKKTADTIFYDSLLFTALLFSYPILVFIISFIIGKLAGFWIGLLCFLLLPASAYCMSRYEHVKTETDLDSRKGNTFGKANSADGKGDT
ncbi:1-acyl-sn-glycerol-3-phosphate acyltransferase [Sphingobacterium deserti]|uniref:Phospholipid/glycerol acyltransferase n=1 Tax=Sphingobacterium deserti TaxID=1229276 RepID=A0A0B8T430_9SPHI|nr:1-acyl-sn-glycerol-3-phosphate acyltransferase [Sphingobacterium deserti]KGE16116.1 phospholipid/glycerol acyltransferase [Sphingobacterium deserti]